MLRHRTDKDIDELVALARTFCEVRAKHQYAQVEGRISPEEDERAREYLRTLDEKLELLKSSSELDHSRATVRDNIIQLPQLKRKAVR